MWLNYAGLGISEHDGHVSPAYRSFWITGPIYRPFAHHLLRSGIYVQGYTRLLTGIRPNSLQLSRDDLMDFPVLCPPEADQVKIADVLDRKTPKVDTLIAVKRRLIELLKEKRQAVISHAVTRGLNPDAPMKPSGTEWLGDVPAHWETSQLRYVVREGTTITYGIVQAGPHIENGVPYIRTSDLAGASLPVDGYPKTSPEIDSAYARSRVGPGDLVIAIRASIGKCLPVPPQVKSANLTQGTAKLSPGDKVVGDFLMWFINSTPAQTYLNFMAKGATFKEITLQTLRKTPVLVPPLAEQAQIVEYIRDVDGAIGTLISEAEGAITLLQERRAALVSAAVMGKIDVRGFAEAA